MKVDEQLRVTLRDNYVSDWAVGCPPCSTMVDVFETGDVPILFSLPQMRNLGTTIELDPQGDKITCPASGLFSSPAECSTMGLFVLDLTSLTYQPTTESSD